MTLLSTSDKPISNVVKWELEKNLSRKVVTLNIASNATIKVGTVLGEVTAGGKYRPSVETAVDGSEDFAGILVDVQTGGTEMAYTAATDYQVVVLTQDAEASKEGLILDSSYDNQTKLDVVYAAMEAAGIRVSENRAFGPLL